VPDSSADPSAELGAESTDPLWDDDVVRVFLPCCAGRHHGSRGHYAGHRPGRLARCEACMALAFSAAAIYARNARHRGLDRAAALSDLAAHPQLPRSRLDDAEREERVRHGRLARPFLAAFGKHYTKALTMAATADRISLGVRDSQRLLGRAIAVRQSVDGAMAAGQDLPWDYIASCEGLTAMAAATAFLEVEAACVAHPPALALLHKHLYAQTEGRSRHLAAVREDLPDAIAAAADDARDGTVEQDPRWVDDTLHDEVVQKLAAAGRDTARDIEIALARRYRELGWPIDHKDVARSARRLLPVAARETCVATVQASTTRHSTVEEVEAALDAELTRRGVRVPGDVDAWLARTARAIVRRARR